MSQYLFLISPKFACRKAWIRIRLAPWIRIRIEIRKERARIRNTALDQGKFRFRNRPNDTFPS
jgi:hypothetical protein